MMNKPILHLNLKKRWFDMILSGEKKEEYREISQYWTSRLSANITIKGKSYRPAEVIICFSNGYRKDRRQFYIECTGLLVGRGRQWWGADAGKDYFVLYLGDIIK